MARSSVVSKQSPMEQFGKLAPAQKALVALLILAGAAVVFYFVFYGDLEEKIAQTKRQKAKLADTLDEYEKKLQDKQRYQEEIRDLEKKRQQALDKLPEKAEIASLLQKIHGQAKIVGLDIKGFERLDEVSHGFYSAIPVMMDLSGTFQQLVTFFYYVGKLTRIVNLTNIEFKLASDADNSTDPVRLTGRVLATTFRYSPEGTGKKSKGKGKKH